MFAVVSYNYEFSSKGKRYCYVDSTHFWELSLYFNSKSQKSWSRNYVDALFFHPLQWKSDGSILLQGKKVKMLQAICVRVNLN